MTVRVRPVTIEHHREPLGIGEAAPRLSWITDTALGGWFQQGYELEISNQETGELQRTGRIDSPQQILIPWPAQELPSRTSRAVRVRVWGADHDPSPWSEPTVLETGLLDPALFRASAISPQLPPAGNNGEPAALLRGGNRPRAPDSKTRANPLSPPACHGPRHHDGAY